MRIAKRSTVLISFFVSLSVIFGAGSAIAVPLNEPASSLFIRSQQPNKGQLERQFSALANPNVPINEKSKVVVGGKKYARVIEKWSGSFTKVNPSFQSWFDRPVRKGNTMTATANARISGSPTAKMTVTYLRQDGLWKIDVEKLCRTTPGNCKWWR